MAFESSISMTLCWYEGMKYLRTYVRSPQLACEPTDFRCFQRGTNECRSPALKEPLELDNKLDNAVANDRD